MSDKHKLFQAWEVAAGKLVKDNWIRKDYPNPAIPSIFHKDGEVVYLLLDDNNQWQPKPLNLKEPTMF